MGFTHQSIVILCETLTTPNSKGKKQSPTVDAGDVQKLMLLLPSVLESLDGLADEALADHVASGGAPVADPFPAVILAINEWLSWYHLLRTPEPDEDDEERLTAMGEALLGTLQHRDVLPLGVRMGNETTRSMWCSTKVHSLLHAPRTLRRMSWYC